MRKIVQKEVLIEYQRTKAGIVCKNYDTLQYIWGSKMAATDLCVRYNVQRLGDGAYLIPLKIIMHRLGELQLKKVMVDNSIKIIEEALASKNL
jgi:hypothetical protein